ncbi:MAG: hypothetical protein DMF88_25495 [Acidobacteria bacterium]|nr:MAG: hypothetical protein DMF88_25495 [Acidobacteriota bacterium]
MPAVAASQPALPLGILELSGVDDDVFHRQHVERRVVIGEDARAHFSVGAHRRQTRQAIQEHRAIAAGDRNPPRACEGRGHHVVDLRTAERQRARVRRLHRPADRHGVDARLRLLGGEGEILDAVRLDVVRERTK